MTILYKVDYQIKLLKEQVQQINNTVVMAPMAPNHLPNQEIPQQPPRTVVTTQQPIESQSVVTDSVQDYIKTEFLTYQILKLYLRVLKLNQMRACGKLGQM